MGQAITKETMDTTSTSTSTVQTNSLNTSTESSSNTISSPVTASSASSGGTTSTTINTAIITEREYTRTEVLQITQTTSTLLFIIDNIVYDVTSFINQHPGGSDVLYDYIGKDATSGFEGVGHSNQARKILQKYKVGILCSKDRV